MESPDEDEPQILTIKSKRKFQALLDQIDQASPDLLKALMVYLKPRQQPCVRQPPPPVPPDLPLEETPVSVDAFLFSLSCFLNELDLNYLYLAPYIYTSIHSSISFFLSFLPQLLLEVYAIFDTPSLIAIHKAVFIAQERERAIASILPTIHNGPFGENNGGSRKKKSSALAKEKLITVVVSEVTSTIIRFRKVIVERDCYRVTGPEMDRFLDINTHLVFNFENNGEVDPCSRRDPHALFLVKTMWWILEGDCDVVVNNGKPYVLRYAEFVYYYQTFPLELSDKRRR